MSKANVVVMWEQPLHRPPVVAGVAPGTSRLRLVPPCGPIGHRVEVGQSCYQVCGRSAGEVGETVGVDDTPARAGLGTADGCPQLSWVEAVHRGKAGQIRGHRLVLGGWHWNR